MARSTHFIVAALSFWIAGCQGLGEPSRFLANSTFESPDTLSPDTSTPEIRPPPPVDPAENLEFCSALAYGGLIWPQSLTMADRRSFLLALNITGSFEGPHGWSTISDNFDNMGLSLGILNQNLGSGSLQPLLERFRKSFPEAYADLLSSSQRKSLDQMLNAWLQKTSKNANTQSKLSEEWDALPQRKLSESSKPDNKYYSLSSSTAELFVLDKSTQESVNWAIGNLYIRDSKKPNTDWEFVPAWKQALKTLASHPGFVSLQIEAALRIHNKARTYQDRLGFTELRSYLMLFDVVVQNGSIDESVFANYVNWFKSNPRASQEAQMLKLVDLRAAQSLPQYRADVRTRKRTIVLGTGVVHRKNRDLPREYCYDGTLPYL